MTLKTLKIWVEKEIEVGSDPTHCGPCAYLQRNVAANTQNLSEKGTRCDLFEQVLWVKGLDVRRDEACINALQVRPGTLVKR